MTIQQAAQQALDVQDASNLSGVMRSCNEALFAVWDEASRQGKGTQFVNRHPIMTLFLLKMCELNGCGSSLDPSYEHAEEECKKLASLSLDTITAT